MVTNEFSLFDLIFLASVVLLGATVVLLLLKIGAQSAFLRQLLSRFDELKALAYRDQERVERQLREEMALSRREAGEASRHMRSEFADAMNQFSVSVREQFVDFRTQLGRLIESNEGKAESLRIAVEQKLSSLQKDNAQRLEEMRKTVSEKLEGTLEKRLGESFKLVSDRLEQVHKGLGEMHNLAVGVGDLKKVMTNVKTRGSWGEIQLGNILEQLLSPEQFDKNVATKKGSSGRVEFAVKMPGRDGDGMIWLPIDAKFPIECYDRLVEAQDNAQPEAVEIAVRQLEAAIKVSARDISEKYLAPPDTTDFAIMYLPTEGLFAEVVRRIGLVEQIQRDFRIVVAGPTTLAALLNSLQMGFRTLAIQKRSSEVWEILAAVKNEFGRFGEVLTKVEKKLQEAGNVINQASTRTRVIEKKLKGVQELPQVDTLRMIGASQFSDEELDTAD